MVFLDGLRRQRNFFRSDIFVPTLVEALTMPHFFLAVKQLVKRKAVSAHILPACETGLALQIRPYPRLSRRSHEQRKSGPLLS